ncbi:MAG: hypothetical protein AAF668_13595 [Pseudomonadota bacterium]
MTTLVQPGMPVSLLLCCLAGALLASGAQSPFRFAVAFGAVFVLVVVSGLTIVPSGIAAMVGALLLITIVRPDWRSFTNPAFSGLLAGVATVSIQSTGVHWSMAVVVTVAVPAIAASGLFRFGMKRLEGAEGAEGVDGAKLMVAVSAFVIAAIPGITDGWRTAQTLNRSIEGGATTMSAWPFAVVGVLFGIGLLKGILEKT